MRNQSFRSVGVGILIQRFRNAIRDNPLIANISHNDSSCDLNSTWIKWRNTVKELAEAHYLQPQRKPRTNARVHHRPPKPWIDQQLVLEIKRKHSLYRRYLHSRSYADWLASRQQSNRVSTLLRHAKSEYIRSNLSNNDTPRETSSDVNGPRLHNLVRCLLKQKRKSIPTLQDGDSHATSDKDKANLLNKFFVSQGQKLWAMCLKNHPQSPSQLLMRILRSCTSKSLRRRFGNCSHL